MPAGNYGTDTDNAIATPPVGFPYYYAGHGRDLVGGSAAADEFYGGADNDILLGGAIASPQTGTGTADNPYSYAHTVTGTGDDYMEGGTGSDAIHGFDGNDELYGGRGDDSGQVVSYGGVYWTFDGKPNAGLYGGDGDDYINGGTGDDDLYGGEDNDYLVGSDGEDNLYGEAGQDNMIGGSDADAFIFGEDLEELDGDRIGDFDRKEDDIIDISAIDARPGGGDNEFDYIGANGFSAKGQVSFKNGKLKFNLDNDNQAEAVMFVNTSKLKDADFEL